MVCANVGGLMEFAKLIEGKDAVFVTPSSCLVGKSKGSYIDSFDIVVKTNGFCMMGRDTYKDYGSRIDILYVNVQFMREVVSKMNPFGEYVPKYACTKNENKNARNQLEKYTKVRNFHRSIEEVSSKVKGLLTGTAVIQDILKFKPKMLYIVGMDIYAVKPKIFVPDDWREYAPGYIPPVIADKANVKNIGRIDPHDYVDNARYINYLNKKYKNLYLDSFTQARIRELII